MTSPTDPGAVAGLVELLRLAFSGELAAAHAYRGHARSLRDPEERRRVAEIEAEEWRHREDVGRMLAELGAAPSRARERRAALVGRVLGALCHVTGWLAPMYGAGRLERRNIREYEQAARLAQAAGRPAWVQPLLEMAEVEWEHERFFRDRVRSHPLARFVPLWPAPPPKATIRGRFRAECGGEAGAHQAGSRPSGEPVRSR
ncbi:MAG TPA: ferritin-like domain-containing protein [Planctomycetota bacterium]